MRGWEGQQQGHSGFQPTWLLTCLPATAYTGKRVLSGSGERSRGSSYSPAPGGSLGGWCGAEPVKRFVLYGNDRLILFTKDSFGIHLNF